MDHAYVEEHGVRESYFKDRLSESERDEFEAHYFACETCLERLETASDFREGMLQVAAEDTARAAAARAQVGLLAGLALPSRRSRWLLGGVLALLAALSLGLFVHDRNLQSQLAMARAASEKTPAQAGAEQRLASLEAQVQALAQADAENRRRLQEALAQAAAGRETAAGPQVNLPLFLLAAVRSGEEAGREPVNRVPLGAATPSVLFSLELATVDYPSYRASLRDESGQEIWQARGLRPDSRDALVILLPSRMLRPGSYRLAIEGARGDGKGFAVAVYPFRVVHP